MIADHLTRQEWRRTLLSIGVVVAIAVLIDTQPAKDHWFLFLVLGGSFTVTLCLGLMVRCFSRTPSPESVRLNQEVHP